MGSTSFMGKNAIHFCFTSLFKKETRKSAWYQQQCQKWSPLRSPSSSAGTYDTHHIIPDRLKGYNGRCSGVYGLSWTRRSCSELNLSELRSLVARGSLAFAFSGKHSFSTSSFPSQPLLAVAIISGSNPSLLLTFIVARGGV